ncbi:MAG: flagellar hook capping protein [Alphaproteobacteria bacterium]|nr:flagellar hook capping protein [Alphaproteobacteria bacterium]
MTDIAPTTQQALPTQGGLSGSVNSQSALSDLTNQFDTFLTLLTTQLQNQDPLEPMDSHEFTNQLVMFTQAEQSIAQNQNLEQLIEITNNNVATAAVSYIGTTVETVGRTGNHLGLGFKGAVDFADAPASATIEVRAEDGTVVYREENPSGLPAGRHDFTWDGTTLDGSAIAPLGNYSVVTTATNGSGDGVAGITTVANTVTGVELDESGVTLVMGDNRVPLDQARSVSVPGL